MKLEYLKTLVCVFQTCLGSAHSQSFMAEWTHPRNAFGKQLAYARNHCGQARVKTFFRRATPANSLRCGVKITAELGAREKS